MPSWLVISIVAQGVALIAWTAWSAYQVAVLLRGDDLFQFDTAGAVRSALVEVGVPVLVLFLITFVVPLRKGWWRGGPWTRLRGCLAVAISSFALLGSAIGVLDAQNQSATFLGFFMPVLAAAASLVTTFGLLWLGRRARLTERLERIAITSQA